MSSDTFCKCYFLNEELNAIKLFVDAHFSKVQCLTTKSRWILIYLNVQFLRIAFVHINYTQLLSILYIFKYKYLWSRCLGAGNVAVYIRYDLSMHFNKKLSVLNLHQLFSNGAAVNTQSRSSLISYAVSRSYSNAIHLRYFLACSKQLMEIYRQSRSRLYWWDAHENRMRFNCTALVPSDSDRLALIRPIVG